MNDITGDMTQDEIDEKLKWDLAGKIGSSTETNPVRLTTAEASRILELLGGPPEKAPEVKAPKAPPPPAPAEDVDEDEKPRSGGRRR
jgi:hypothetical protein